MLCKKPVTVGSQVFSCGTCEPCRINRKRIWTNRLLLESGEHADNSFWTLTYREESLPRIASGLSSLCARDAQLFMKRIRKAHLGSLGGHAIGRLRFYLVGEYGDVSERPHYHVALFGFPSCVRGQTLRMRGRPDAEKCCDQCRMVHRAWGLGDVDGGMLVEASAKYLVGYVLKKMTRYDDVRLDGRDPEFARMSLRPGIGHNAMYDVADVILRLGLDDSEADVPSALRRGSTIAPLGHYLRRRLRLMVGKEVKCPDEVLKKIAEEMLPLRMAARESKDNPSLKGQIVEAFKQDVLNRETRSRIFGKRGSI